jgi:glycosyltransferase involved in cell wall biosynthesis
MNPTSQAQAPAGALELVGAADGEPEQAAPFDMVVADASWSWTERLFTPLSQLGVRLLLLKACDWRTALNQGRALRTWFPPLRRVEESLWERSLVLPPGWMKTYPRVGMRPLSQAVRQWRGSLESPRPLALAISYPHYLYLRDRLRPHALIYYNMDDYAFYWSSRRKAIRELERRAVREADLSVFCAKIRADEFRSAVPEAADRIVHLPHGAPANSIAAEPQHRPADPPPDLAKLPRPLLGFVGSLEDRLDWDLIDRVAGAFPDGSIILIGGEPRPAPRRAWYHAYLRATRRPNVHRLGWRPQTEIGRYNAAFDVCLIPYRTDHPFNRVACPTKVMDYMATSRPVVSTAVPECQLYDHLFDIALGPDEFIAAIRRIVANDSDDGRALPRWEVARGATWERTSALLLQHFVTQTMGRF